MKQTNINRLAGRGEVKARVLEVKEKCNRITKVT
jgi:hypothetical protein